MEGQLTVFLLLLVIIFDVGYSRTRFSSSNINKEKAKQGKRSNGNDAGDLPEEEGKENTTINNLNNEETAEELDDPSPVLPEDKEIDGPSPFPPEGTRNNEEVENQDDFAEESHDPIPLPPEGNNEGKDKQDDSIGAEERSLSVGDTFTPPELLPVAEKLLTKVEEPGLGKGIVSSAQRPEELADKLFESFFFTSKRIVILNENDITGLDALQALALSGEEADLRSIVKSDEVAESNTEPINMVTISLRGQTISVNTEPKKSQYRLLKKNNNIIVKKKVVLRRGAIKSPKKIQKSRHIALFPGRRNVYHKGKSHKVSKNKDAKLKTRTKKRQQGVPVKAHMHRMKSIKNKRIAKPLLRTEKQKGPVSTNSSGCHWRYECSNPNELDSCRVKTECDQQVEFHGVPHQEDEHSPAMLHFRKMLGITLVDEEVEKILEKRYISVKPPDRLSLGQEDADRVESLGEYFNNIIMAELESTTPVYMQNEDMPKIMPLDDPEGAIEGRKNLRIPTRTTQKS